MKIRANDAANQRKTGNGEHIDGRKAGWQDGLRVISTKTRISRQTIELTAKAFSNDSPKKHERDRNIAPNCKAPSDGVLGPPLVPDVHPDDHGGYGIGLDGPAFPSRRFAEAVACGTRHHDMWVQR
jgi:hypothetical protein